MTTPYQDDLFGECLQGNSISLEHERNTGSYEGPTMGKIGRRTDGEGSPKNTNFSNRERWCQRRLSSVMCHGGARVSTRGGSRPR